MTAIIDIHAREILDSRGRPTVWAECQLDSGAVGAASNAPVWSRLQASFPAIPGVVRQSYSASSAPIP